VRKSLIFLRKFREENIHIHGKRDDENNKMLNMNEKRNRGENNQFKRFLGYHRDNNKIPREFKYNL